MNDIEQDRYWTVARDKPALLIHMMRYLAGDAHISFEGDLSRCSFPSWIPRLEESASILERNTAAPRQDYIILALEHDTIRPIFDAVLPDNRYMKDIIHIQIEKSGHLQFGTYDNFHPQCIVCFLGVGKEFLDELKEKGIIRSWTTPYAGAIRWHG